MATLKKELEHIWAPVEHFTRSDLRAILFDHVEVFDANRYPTAWSSP